MDVNRLNDGEKAAGLGGIILLISLWLDWYSVSVHGFGVGGSVNAWDAFSVIQIILFLTALAAIGAAIIKGTDSSIELPVAASSLVAALGALSVVLILYRLISTPGGSVPSGFGVSVDADYGLFVGLISAAAVTYGGYRGMQEEGTSFGE